MNAQSPIDFVILTPLAEERDAVLARLPGYRKLPPSNDDLRVHYASDLPVTFPDGSTTSYAVIVTPLAKMGHNEASAATSDVIHRWKPRYVLLVGIAGGFGGAGVKLGDVLISEQVADYELAKVTPEKDEIRWQVYRVDQRLYIAAQNFEGDLWRQTKSRRYDKRIPEVHYGPICTGNKVVADDSLAAQFREVWSKLIGVEMEAGGAANAASQSARQTGFFMIRGVSDLADGNKDSSSVKRWRPYAREIAAAWAIEFLKSGPVPVSVGPSRDDTAPDVAGLNEKREQLDSTKPTEPKWTDELRIYGEGFVGRKEELAALDRAWAEGVRIFALHAEGGAGKTRVVVEWLRRMRDDGWRGARRVFVHSFYSQGSDERRNASSELFFDRALAYFGYHGEPITQADERGRTLARLFVEHHGLLVLDGLEPLQHPPLHAERGRLKDPGIARLLLSLASVGRISTPTQDKAHGLCLITSRQPVIELQERTGATVAQQSLDQLHRSDGAALLKEFHVVGPDDELRRASDEFHGHAYSLMLLGSYLKNATDHHDIRRRREVVLLGEDAEYGNHAQKMFAAYSRHLGEDSPEVAVLRLLGFFDRAAERQLLDVLRAQDGLVYEWSNEADKVSRRPQPKRIEDSLADVTTPLLSLQPAQWHRTLNRLRDLKLIDFTDSGTSGVVVAHPLLCQCFAEQARTQFPVGWRSGHRRLFEHLAGSVPYWPEGTDGLQPLYQAVVHGCLADLHQEVCNDIFHNRILRGSGEDGFYSSRKLGAIGADLGAVACLFTTPWTTLASSLKPFSQGWVLSVAASNLRALGRLTEAVEPLQEALKMWIRDEDWMRAARDACNLSELELTRGRVSAAVTAAKQAVTYADRKRENDPNRFIESCATLAGALHQAGYQADSRRRFEDAESRQAAPQQNFPQLYSLGGFRYCDLLLSDAERLAWQRWLFTPFTAPIVSCDAILERASRGLVRARTLGSLLDIGLLHLTLARATIYGAQTTLPLPQAAGDHIRFAVEGLRAAGNMSHLPSCLLTRAWLRCLTGDVTGCREDLGEAWEIAERGPMPLFQADIQLYRARLFRDRAALAEARRLIEKHGYHRRDEELVDAEAVARGWPETATSKPSQPVEPKTNEGSMRDQIFISYSHKDKKFMEELLTHLEPYLRSGSVEGWCDRDIVSGSKWFDELQAALSKTSVAILLVSPDFLASDFIHDHELTPLLKKAELGGVKILWVQIRASAYEETSLKNYQAVVSPPDKPLGAKTKADRDEAWVQVCKVIKNAVNP